jgi:hypothetical protein
MDGKLVNKAGETTAKTTTSGYEVALAGRGFSKEIEVAYQKEKKIDYSGVVRMENFGKTPQEIIAFLNEGGVNPPGGAP